MFRAQQLRRSFSLFKRVPYARIAQSAARDGYETVQIQRFRIRKPFFSKQRLVGTAFVAGAIYGLGRYVGIEIEIGEIDKKEQSREGRSQDDQDWQQAGEEQDQQHEDDEDYEDALLFFPTGFSRSKPRTYYRGSDPEWQEFRKLATDRPRIERIRSEFTTLIRDVVDRHAVFKNIGKIDRNKGKVWIEFSFPDGPPIEYERPGVELTDELVWRKATRPVEHAHHQRLNKLLTPTAASDAVFKDTMRRVDANWKSFRVYMGWDDKPSAVQVAFQRVLANPSVPDGTKLSPTGETHTPTAVTTTSSDNQIAKDLGITLPSSKELTLDLATFRQDFNKGTKPGTLQPPRGAFLVIGMIECYGQHARLTLNAVAAYDPKQGKFVGIKLTPFNVVLHKQPPRGGP